MRRTPGVLAAGLTAAALGVALVAPIGSAVASPSHPSRPSESAAPATSSDTDSGARTLGPDYKISGKPDSAVPQKVKRQMRAEAKTPTVGDVKYWPFLEYLQGTWNIEQYTLRGIGDHIQVWVANDTSFPEGDCRNDLGLTDITDEQVSNFIHEFDTNIYPKESASFSVPPALDGTNALAPQYVNGMPEDYYQGTPDEAGDTVVLVDNVKDENYFDPGTPDGQTYVAGFFTSTFNLLTDRNVMTIDAYDWMHRTGANPPDDTADPAYQQCGADLGYNRPLGSSNPRLYEGTFAHEYQHLLESYEDPDEVNWINEGLSDYAQTLVGYVDTRIPPMDDDADGHIACFDGYMDPSFGGPENSLTMWGDQGGPEILCDYGAAYSMMMYLYSHYGESFMSNLHRIDANGFAGLDKALDKAKSKKSAKATLHDWAAAMALDAALDKSKVLHGAKRQDFQASWLSSSINWGNDQAFESPGAPPNGSDYVRLRHGDSWFSAKQLKSLSFKGASTLAPDPVEWTVDQTPPDTIAAGDATCGSTEPGAGAAAIYSGCGDDLDRSVVREVSVPAGGGTLSFDTLYDIEDQWDYGFVQVSTDGGKSWTSLATEDTTTDHDPQANPVAVANLPGLTGSSDGWVTETADLSAYAGKSILLGFRYVTDGAVSEAGFWVRNVSVAGTALPTDTIDGWKSITQVNPIPVKGWTIQLVGIAHNGHSWIKRVNISKTFRAHMGQKALEKALGKRAGIVSALVMVDDPSESLTKYARYQLKINGTLQPGG